MSNNQQQNNQFTAEEYKKQGNAHFASFRYEAAIDSYTTAIIKNPYNAIFYSNRAVCFLKLKSFDRVIMDCEKACSIDPFSVKAHYLFGQALTESNLRLTEAVTALKKAYNMGVEQKVNYIEDILNVLRKAKKMKWELSDQVRREEASDIYRYIKDLINRDRRRQEEQLPYPKNQEDVKQINDDHDYRLSQFEAIFSQADEKNKKREIPDYVTGKISFEIMTDPVLTPCGITYDKPEIIQHLSKIGSFDPISRRPLQESQLIPNLAMKEVVEDFMLRNGWAIDF